MGAEWRYVLPAPLRRLPADLAVVLCWVGLTVGVVATPVVGETPLRALLGLPFLLFLPGYALVALLFPEAGSSPATLDAVEPGASADADVGAGVGGDASTGAGGDPSAEDGAVASDGRGASADDVADGWAVGSATPGSGRGIDGVERVALSFGLSIAVVPLLGLALNFTPWGIRLWPVLLTVGGVTAGCALGAAQRRRQLPAHERFRVPYRAWVGAAHAAVFEPEDRFDAALSVVLGASVLLAVGSVGYAVAVPPDGEQFTEFYVLTEDDERLVAADYPQELTVGEPEELVVGVANQEHGRENYTVVVQLQRVETVVADDGTNRTAVREREELTRYRTSLAHNETWLHRHEVTPTTTGEDLRLRYLLYRDSVPPSPTGANAYRDLHLWVDVAEAESDAAS